MVAAQFAKYPLTAEGKEDFLEALDTVWRKRETDRSQEALRLRQRIKSINETIDQKVDAATDPTNATIKDLIWAR